MLDLVRLETSETPAYVRVDRIISISRSPDDMTKTVVVWDAGMGAVHAIIDSDPDEVAQMIERAIPGARIYTLG